MIEIRHRVTNDIILTLELDTLQNANLYNANLQGADLRSANLENADLQHANLWYANLQHANLQHANLRCANLQHAILRGADLRGADLQHADLQDVQFDEECLKAITHTTPGELIAYKKTRQGVITIKIPENARRSNAATRKCRAEFAIPIEMPDGITECTSLWETDFVYRLNEVARCDHWDDNRWNECSGGIHFFLTREEAEQFQL